MKMVGYSCPTMAELLSPHLQVAMQSNYMYVIGIKGKILINLLTQKKTKFCNTPLYLQLQVNWHSPIVAHVVQSKGCG